MPYRSQGYRGCCEPNKPSVAGVRLVDGVGVVLAELVHDPRDSLVVLRIEGAPDEGLELEGAALALVIDLVAEQPRDRSVHVAVWVWVGSCYMALPRVCVYIYCMLLASSLLFTIPFWSQLSCSNCI